ncbi:UNVERIFIED_CONTAM: hypothetical protein GTU68_024827 [Idotea baltica]|nr:hypothetical protein [Idotea baltica]
MARQQNQESKFTAKPITKKNSLTNTENKIPLEGIRLNKYVANAGICSRRKADEHIANGLVTVNKEIIYEMGHRVKPNDQIRFEGKLIENQKRIYLLLNKQKNVISTTTDPKGRKTVMDCIGKQEVTGLYPVGRLDRNTVGLIMITNDGELAQKLAHPSGEVQKLYYVELDKPLSKRQMETIVDGIELEEGIAIVDELAYVDGDKKMVGIKIHIGWNRVVRRIFESMGFEVKKLDRVMYAHLTKKDLPRGRYRHLTEREIIALKHFNTK